jgi:hypothetical protein
MPDSGEADPESFIERLRESATTRRSFLAAVVGTGAGGTALAQLQGGGDVYGGTMALSEAYQVADGVWVGPATARSNVNGDSGNLFIATDEQVNYFGDSGSWSRLGVGSDAQPVPAVNTEQAAIAGRQLAVHPTQQRASVGLNKGLQAYWEFEDPSGGVITDQSGNGNDISLSGSPSTVSGIINNGLAFDGTDDEGTVPASASLDITDGDFTVSGWMFQNNSQSWQPMLVKAPDSGIAGSAGFAIYNVQDNLSYIGADKQNSFAFLYGDGSGTKSVNSERVAGFGPWYHVVGTYQKTDSDGSIVNRAEIWVNGVRFATEFFSSSPVTGEEQIQIGKRGGTLLDGGLDQIRIYDRKLSREEIIELYYRGVGAHERFDCHLRGETLDQAATYANAIWRYDSSKTDPYRLLTKNQDNDDIDLFISSDLETWTKAVTDVYSGWTGGNENNLTPADYVKDGSGTFWTYLSENGDTHVFSGADFGTQSYDSVALSNDTDVGAYRADDGTVYLYPEEDQEGVSAGKIGVYTASSPNGSFSRVGTALDFAEADVHWKGGDAEVFEWKGVYWMFNDMTTGNQQYGTAVARSDDLISWELVSEDIKRNTGGDLKVTNADGDIKGVTELTGERSSGMGFWDVHYRQNLR